MKSKFLKVVSLLLVVVTLVSTLISITACKKKPQPENDKWEISDADYESMSIADVSASAHDGNRYVTLTATDSLFKSDIAKDDIKVVAYHTNKANIDSMSEEDIEKNADNIFTETTITDVNIYANDQASLMFSFKEPEYDYMCSYFFYVHKNAVEKNVFTFAFDNVYLESSVTPEAKIMTELKNGQVNPTIQVKLVNAKAVSEIKTEDISLSGALEGMKVVSAVSSEDTITIETEGKVEISLAPYGYVQLSAPTNDQDVFVLAMTEIEQLSAYVNAETFALQEGLLHFDIDIIGAEYAVTEIELASHVTLDGFEIESVQVFDDQDIMRLFVKCDADNVDNAIKSLFGKTLVIDGKAIGGDGISVEMNATCASLGGVIDSIDKVKGEDKYTATVELFARNGSMSELSAEDIVFGGDFEGAEIISIKNGVGYTSTVEFTFSAKDKTSFNGSVTVPQSKLFDMWGSTSGNTSIEISYVLEGSRRRYTALEQLLDKIGDISSKNFGKSISDVVSAFMESGITKFFSGDILGALGSLFADVTPSGREYEIHCMVTEMKVMMQNLDRDVKELKNSIQAYGDDILAAAQKNTLLALESKWNAFNTNYMERLERTVNSFNSACRRSIVDFVKSEHGEGLTIYYDGDGKLAIRDKSNPFYSVDAKVIDESKTVTIPLSDKSFTACQAIFAKTGFKYSNELAVALMTDLGNAVKAMNEEGDMSIVYSTQMGEILYQYLYQQMMFNNLTSDFMDNLRADFVNLCKQITEGQKVLDSFYEMMKYKYNFQSEAIQDMENIRETLLVLLFNYGATASFVENYDSASTNNDMSTAIEKAINYIKNNDGLYSEPEGYSYCYAVGRPITLRISDMTYGMRIKYSCKDDWRFKGSAMAWNYDGYEDNGSSAGYYRAEYFRSNTGIARVDELLNRYEGYRTYDDLNADRVTMKSNNILSSKDLGLLKARFNSIKATGNFPEYNDLTFGEYLTNGKVVKAPFEYMVHLIPEDQFSRRIYVMKPTRIATAGYKISDFPVDGSRTLIANKDHLADGMTLTTEQREYWLNLYKKEAHASILRGGSGTFTHGNKYAIGSGVAEYEEEINREYFHIHKEITQDIYDMKTDTMKNDYPVTQVALYGEHHAMWSCDYGSYFYNADYGEKYFIFPIG